MSHSAGMVAKEGSYQDGEGTWTEAGVDDDLAEVNSKNFFRKLLVVGSEERMWEPSLRMHLILGRPE